jgi:hypothetical protein
LELTEEEFKIKAQEYQKKAENLQDRQSLINLWEQIQRKKTPGWESGYAFEYLVIRAFQFEDLQVTWPYPVTLPQKIGTVEQIDGVVYFEGKAFLIESKHRVKTLGVEAVAKLRLRLERRPPGTMGIIFSVSDFTPATEVFAQFASPLNVILWGASDFEYAIRNGGMCRGLQHKLKYAIEDGLALTRLGVQR